MSSVVINSVQRVPSAAFPAAWDDVEVVDGVLVEDAPPASADDGPPAHGTAAAADDARIYDRTGRVPAFRRFGRIVSVVA